ncbi:hypothetical protein D3C74_236700 [compost metagenome]
MWTGYAVLLSQLIVILSRIIQISERMLVLHLRKSYNSSIFFLNLTLPIAGDKGRWSILDPADFLIMGRKSEVKAG